MAVPKKRKPVKKKKETKPIIPEKYQDLVFCLILVAAIFVFFSGAIFSGGFNADDNVASVSFRPYMGKANSEGVFPLWMPYIFGGMPGYAALLTSGNRLWDIVPQIIISFSVYFGKVFSSDVARVIFFYMLYGIGMYMLMRFKKHERFVSFFTSFAAVFSTSVIIWVMIGHNTKPMVFAMFPFIFIFLEKLRIKFSLVYSAMLVFAIHFMMVGGHMQMIFYGICAFGLYLIFEFISRLISKNNPSSVLRAGGILVIAGIFAFLMSADRFLSTMEYTPYSTRGSAPIDKTEKTHTTETGGNDYEYATMWSFSPEEMTTFFVPDYFGFGKLKYKGPLTNNQEIMIRPYWGQKPFEDAAPYMGISVLGLAFMGFVFYRKNVFIQFLAALSIFSLLLSFGKNFSILYDFFYYNVPSFNKFRAPSMALVLIQFAVPVMAGYGLTGIIKYVKENKEGSKKIFNVFMIGSLAFLVLGFIFSSVFKSTYISAVGSSPSFRMPADFKDFVWSEMISDWYLTAFLAVAAFALVWLFVRKNLSRGMFFTAMAVIMIFDLLRVAYRPMEYDDVSIEDKYFQKTDYYKFIDQDQSLYRIADFASYSPNIAAYFFRQNVNGYHAAKLRIIQDILDECNLIEPGSTSNLRNNFLWNLMNVKYIITDGKLSGNGPLLINIHPGGQNSLKPNMPVVFQSQTGAYIFKNKDRLPRTFFVAKAVKEEPKKILKHLKIADFNPRQTAYVEKDIPKTDAPDSSAKAEITEYKDEYIKIDVSATGNNLLFLGEMYYPPGWKAYIDGNETEIYKTNYGFRSVIVPEGNHTVEFKYKSENFEEGKLASIIINIITIGLLAAGLFLERKRKK